MNHKRYFNIRKAARAWLALCMLLIGAVEIHAGNLPDYSLLDELLLENVRNGFVDYDGFRADARFQQFIDQIGTADPNLLSDKNQKLAFYINAYNALAIDGIINGESPESRWSRRKFFRSTEYTVLGEQLTLDDIEKEKIHTLGDARIHFAIVCASLSCPRLSNRAYTPERVDYQLHDAAQKFINDPTRNRYGLERSTAFLSMIFKWYGDDFGAAGGSIQRYISRFADDPKVADALREEKFDIRYLDYDWNLNGHMTDNSK